MLRVLIVENEKNVADVLISKLKNLFSDVEVLEVCETVEKSLNAINRTSPDVVFLDVELNNGESGFDILKKLSNIPFEIIFTTAYNKYAIQAIKFSALDYLKKPIDDDELKIAIEKFRSKKSSSFREKQIEILLSNLNNPSSKQSYVALPTMDGLISIRLSDIIYCEGASSQTTIHMLGKKHDVISRTLKECEELLDPLGFCRIHKSYLINLEHFKKYIKGKDGTVVLSENISLEVSRNYKEEFLKRIQKF